MRLMEPSFISDFWKIWVPVERPSSRDPGVKELHRAVILQFSAPNLGAKTRNPKLSTDTVLGFTVQSHNIGYTDRRTLNIVT